MNNSNENVGTSQTVPLVDIQFDFKAPGTASEQVIVLVGDLADRLTDEQLAEITGSAKEGKLVASVEGSRRVLIVGDLHTSRHLARELALAHLACDVMVVDALAIRPDDKIAGAELLELCVKTMPVMVSEFPDVEEGKSRRNRPWESPYGYHGGKQQKFRQPQRNIKQMMRRRGGR
jgi:hypothetical protein